MRRPAIAAAIAFGLGVLFSFEIEIVMLLWILILTAAGTFLVWSILYSTNNLIRNAAIFFFVFAAGGIWVSAFSIMTDPLIQIAGTDTVIEGIVTEIDRDEDKYSLVVKSKDSKVLVRFYGNNETLKGAAGRTVRAAGKIEEPAQQRNPGCFDYKLYLKSCGIQMMMNAEKIELVHGEEVPYLKWSGKIKNDFKNMLIKYLDSKHCGLIMAVMFGDKTLLDEDLYYEFQRNGTAHVLAVSGLHTGIIYAFFVMVWRGRKGLLFYLTSLGMLFMYITLADFSPSVVRAVCMIVLHSAAGLLHYRYDLLSAAGVTFTAMLIHNPYQLFNMGFQLSFLAIVSLGVIMCFVKRFYQGIFLSAIAIQAGMTPYTAYVFNYISLGSALANIPAIFIAGILLPFSLCALISTYISEHLFGFLITAAELCCDCLIAVNDFFYMSGQASIDVVSPPVWILVVYYGTVFFLLSEAGQLMIIRKQKQRIAVVICLILVAAVICVPVTRPPLAEADIIFVDVGQGDCIHIKTKSGKNYMIDGGGSENYDVGMKNLKPYLLKNGIRRIDASFVTHLHTDHYDGIRSLAVNEMTNMLAVYDANKFQEEELKKQTGAEIMYLHRGHRIKLDREIYLEVISPEKKSDDIYSKMIENEEDENKSSLIIKIDYEGTTLLVTGDIDEEGEADLIEMCGNELRCDIIKVPHHGSKYSSSEEFIEMVSPDLAVFQVGKNNYGHPSEDVIRRYTETGCQVVRNDMEGAIGIDIRENGSFKVLKMID